jgi:hypothetical protein
MKLKKRQIKGLGSGQVISLETFTTEETVVEELDLAPCVPKKGKKMFYDEDGMMVVPTTDAQVTKEYLTSRASQIFFQKVRDAESEFGMVDDQPPKDTEEFIQRIKDGKYRLWDNDRRNYYRWQDRIRWRTRDEDQEGFEKKSEQLGKMLTETKDVIMVSDAEKGLAALKAFESA